MVNLTGKIAIITGATSGIGKACALALGQHGCKVVITGRDVKKLQATANEFQVLGIDCLGIQADVQVEADHVRMINETINRFGSIDILINNAGISMRALFQDVDIAVLKQVMDSNFWGTVYATKYALPHLIKSKGMIVGISSIAGFRGLPGRTGYSASKFAMQGFLESLRTELLPHGVHVLIACPGFTATNIRYTALDKKGAAQTESPRDEKKMMTAEQVAEKIIKAIQKRKKILILTFMGRFTVFLNKWFSGWMDKKVYNHFTKENDSPMKSIS